MPVAVAMHGVENAHLIDHLGRLGKERTGPNTRLTMLRKSPPRSNQITLKRARLIQPPIRCDLLPMVAD